MAKKHFGRFLAFAAIAGAAAAGISYFLQYKSFHKELDEEFHDFEDDFDEFEDTDDNSSTVTRNYVSLTPDRKNEEATDGRNDEVSDVTADEEVSALSGQFLKKPKTEKKLKFPWRRTKTSRPIPP